MYHVFIDFKKILNRGWHKALCATMSKYNIIATCPLAKEIFPKASKGEKFMTVLTPAFSIGSSSCFQIMNQNKMSKEFSPDPGKIK